LTNYAKIAAQKKRMLNNLIRKLDKTGSTDRTSAIAVFLALRDHTTNTDVVLSLNKEIDQWLKD